MFERMARVLAEHYKVERKRFFDYGAEDPTHLTVRRVAEALAIEFESEVGFDREAFLAGVND